MTQRMLKEMKRDGREHQAFDALHHKGAERFGWNWIKANQWAVDVASEFGLDPTEHRLMLSNMAWKMLANMGAPRGGLPPITKEGE